MVQDGLGAGGAPPGDSGTGGPAARDGTGPGRGSSASHMSTPKPPWALALPRLQGGKPGQWTLAHGPDPPGGSGAPLCLSPSNGATVISQQSRRWQTCKDINFIYVLDY